MDYDEVSNISSRPNNEPITPSRSREDIAQETIFAIFAVIGIVSNIFILTTILKYKRLRTVSMIFVGNWAFSDLCSATATLSFFRLLVIWKNFSIAAQVVCILVNLGRILHIAVQLFATVIVVHWTFEAVYWRGHVFMERNYKCILGFVWVITLLHAMIDWGICVYSSSFFHPITTLIILLSYGLSALLVIILQITRAVKKCRRSPFGASPFMLNLVTCFVGSLFLGIISALLNALLSTEIFTLIIGPCLMSTATINLYLLYSKHQEFQACFRELIKCRSNQYDETDLINETTTPEVVALPKLNNQQEIRAVY